MRPRSLAVAATKTLSSKVAFRRAGRRRQFGAGFAHVSRQFPQSRRIEGREPVEPAFRHRVCRPRARSAERRSNAARSRHCRRRPSRRGSPRRRRRRRRCRPCRHASTAFTPTRDAVADDRRIDVVGDVDGRAVVRERNRRRLARNGHRRGSRTTRRAGLARRWWRARARPHRDPQRPAWQIAERRRRRAARTARRLHAGASILLKLHSPQSWPLWSRSGRRDIRLLLKPSCRAWNGPSRKLLGSSRV